MYDAQHNVLNSNIHVPASTLTGANNVTWSISQVINNHKNKHKNKTKCEVLD